MSLSAAIIWLVTAIFALTSTCIPHPPSNATDLLPRVPPVPAQPHRQVLGLQISDEQYQKCLDLGSRLWQQLATPLTHTGPNDPNFHPESFSYNDLARYGYQLDYKLLPGVTGTPFDKFGIHEALNALGLLREDGLLATYYEVEITQPTTWEGQEAGAGEPLRTYRGGGALIRLSIWPNQNVLAVDSVLSASSLARHTGWDTTQITPLHRTSDVLFLAWEYFAEPHRVQAPGHILLPNVLNDEVLAVLIRALNARGPKTIGTWEEPTTFDMMSGGDDAKAMLGTPLISAIARFLIQHKMDFGDRRITKVIFWDPDSSEEERWILTNEVKEMEAAVQGMVVVA